MRRTAIKSAMGMLAALSLAACAEGTTVVTGAKRPAIDPSQVQILAEPPKTAYEVIALVRAISGNGWTRQQSLDYAVDELKNQAAAVGANGVILQRSGSQLGGFVMSGDIAIPFDEETVSGSAIYIER